MFSSNISKIGPVWLVNSQPYVREPEIIKYMITYEHKKFSTQLPKLFREVNIE